MSSEKTEERRKQNRKQISGIFETSKRKTRGPNKIKFSDLPPERQAEIRANKSRAGKVSAGNLTPEERRNRASNAGKIGGPIGGPIGGKAAADKMTAEQKSDRGRRGGKASADKLTAEERRNRSSNAGKIGGLKGGPIGGKVTAKKNQETGYQNLVNARDTKNLYKTMNYTEKEKEQARQIGKASKPS